MCDVCVYDNELQKLLVMEELASSPLTNQKCSSSSAEVQVKNISASWSCDKKNPVLEDVAFEIDQVHSSLINNYGNRYW